MKNQVLYLLLIFHVLSQAQNKDSLAVVQQVDILIDFCRN